MKQMTGCSGSNGPIIRASPPELTLTLLWVPCQCSIISAGTYLSNSLVSHGMFSESPRKCAILCLGQGNAVELFTEEFHHVVTLEFPMHEYLESDGFTASRCSGVSPLSETLVRLSVIRPARQAALALRTSPVWGKEPIVIEILSIPRSTTRLHLPEPPVDDSIEDDHPYTQQHLKVSCQIPRVEHGQQILCDEVRTIGGLATLRAQPILQRRERADPPGEFDDRAPDSRRQVQPHDPSPPQHKQHAKDHEEDKADMHTQDQVSKP